jgi:hypothetical protein
MSNLHGAGVLADGMSSLAAVIMNLGKEKFSVCSWINSVMRN